MKTPTDTELNLAMCELDGWHHIEDGYGVSRDRVVQLTGSTHRTLPNYPSDDSPRRLLNEAEAKLTDDQWDKYCDLLGGSLRACTSANARQRVIALLQVVRPNLFQ